MIYIQMSHVLLLLSITQFHHMRTLKMHHVFKPIYSVDPPVLHCRKALLLAHSTPIDAHSKYHKSLWVGKERGKPATFDHYFYS